MAIKGSILKNLAKVAKSAAKQACPFSAVELQHDAWTTDGHRVHVAYAVGDRDEPRGHLDPSVSLPAGQYLDTSSGETRNAEGVPTGARLVSPGASPDFPDLGLLARVFPPERPGEVKIVLDAAYLRDVCDLALAGGGSVVNLWVGRYANDPVMFSASGHVGEIGGLLMPFGGTPREDDPLVEDCAIDRPRVPR